MPAIKNLFHCNSVQYCLLQYNRAKVYFTLLQRITFKVYGNFSTSTQQFFKFMLWRRGYNRAAKCPSFCGTITHLSLLSHLPSRKTFCPANQPMANKKLGSEEGPRSRKKNVHENLKSKTCKLYVMFLKFVMNHFEMANKILQYEYFFKILT